VAGELAHGSGRAIHDRRDLIERHAEDVVQYEGETLGRLEGLQHHEEREADRVRMHRIGLRIPVGAGDQGIGHVGVQGTLPARGSRPQHSRHTRATTVVSQARRFSTSLTSARPSRIPLEGGRRANGIAQLAVSHDGSRIYYQQPVEQPDSDVIHVRMGWKSARRRQTGRRQRRQIALQVNPGETGLQLRLQIPGQDLPSCAPAISLHRDSCCLAV